jgi:c-di-GMP-binding flagellar brake protein YcgR
LSPVRVRHKERQAMSPTDPNSPSEPPKPRRRQVRTKVAVEIELQLEKHATPLRTKTVDLSLGGCYIDMLFTLEVGTKVNLTLTINDEKISAEGVVANRDLKAGNGIQFTAMSAEDSDKLKKFLAVTPDVSPPPK